MSNLVLPGTLNFSPAEDFTQACVPASWYSQLPATHSMISGAPVLNVKVAGKITPTDFLLPSAKVSWWLTHLPSKKTLAVVLTDTPSMWVVVMVILKNTNKSGCQDLGNGF
jgi:hypothetical protein